jgi:phosphoribosylformylglycinamidine synthase
MAAIAPDVYLSMGLNKSEYEKVLELLGREPSHTELGMFAVMWSEHCGYKYSRPILAYFKKYKEAIEGQGLENAGIVDIGDGLGVVMKVESHNHPSAVEPYQGAATGVGGIIRDIFTMGARPIASLNSLRFGPIEEAGTDPDVVRRNRYLFGGVVAGIAGYGNCVGVPTVAGEVAFHPRYSGNPLVNAMCVGIVRLDRVATAAAKGVGNPVIYLGSATGKDGIHGATFASDTLGQDSDEKRPNVQIGDPFAEKILIEATLEALQTGAIVAIQDMGAAGITCSTTEMSSKGGVGMNVDLDLVPTREQGMSAYEIVLSESQERMLCVAHAGREQEVIDVFKKWGANAVVVGHVTDDGIVTCTRNGKVEVRLPARLLTDECPTYTVPPQEPEYFRRATGFDPTQLPEADNKASLLALLSSPTLASKRWVFEQYDYGVQTQTALVPGKGDAAVLAPRGTQKGLAVKIDGNGRWVYLDPYVGGQLAVVEAARNVACTGARPAAVTDGLNFGNPQLPHVYWQFQRAVRGVADACEAMRTPVVSGNVSFYNESDLGEVLPTPIIGVLGVLGDAAKRVGMAMAQGQQIALLSYENEIKQQGLGASSFLAEIHGIEDGQPVAPNLEMERALCDTLAELVENALITAAHDVSEGGTALAAAEMCVAGGVGASLDLRGDPFAFASTAQSALYAEIPGFVLVTYQESRRDAIKGTLRQGLCMTEVGESGGAARSLTIAWKGAPVLEIPVEDLARAYDTAIPRIMDNRQERH